VPDTLSQCGSLKTPIWFFQMNAPTT